ncbi:hypothetical protein FBU59_006904 [Linderina macrospora]|uniref:Uncharacterized protein n=1 Tax=Linderina macrospora TaxID=4868 RepID=A0ACC1IYJ7_9FUNG|nr:hypothetical protein FBU59_006904 [Linderina macrospora]
MAPFANTVVDVMTLGKGKYAGRVDGSTGDGHGSSTNYLRGGYLLMAEFRPEAKKAVFGADLQVGKATGSVDQFSRCMWVKHRLAK